MTSPIGCTSPALGATSVLASPDGVIFAIQPAVV